MLHSDVTDRRVRAGVTASALCFAIAGAMLLFAPDEAMPGSGRPVLVQLLGAALLGYGAANWIARGAALGGIYGRAVVAGSQTHLTVGALLLVKNGVEIGTAHPGYWALTVIYVLGSAFFTYLTFFSSGLRTDAEARRRQI